MKTPGYDRPQTVPLALDLWADERSLPKRLAAPQVDWLLENGLLSARMMSAAQRSVHIAVIEERVGFLSNEQKHLLAVRMAACFVREVELLAGDSAWVFSQTLVPDATLELHPWLAALGSSELEATLSGLRCVERGPREFALLPAAHPLIARALRGAELAPAALWARRRWHALAGQRFLVQEVLLPACGRG